MGRGRAKAKQTKVARELKYGGPSTDLTALQRELSNSGTHVPVEEPVEDEEDFDDDYSQYLEEDDE